MPAEIKSKINLYKNESKELISVLNLDTGNAANNFFQCNYSVYKQDDKTALQLSITLHQTIAPYLEYTGQIIFDTSIQIQKIYNPFPEFNHKSFSATSFIIDTNKGHFVIRTEKSTPFEISKNSLNDINVKAIIDAAFLHLSWDLSKGLRSSTAGIEQATGTVYNFNYTIQYFNNSEFIPIQQSIYPHAKKAAFILTDHCDFDNAEKLRLFLYGNDSNGWLGKNLKITKGVFTLAPFSGEPKKNDSLEDEPYASLIKELYKDGSEIVPHALKSKGQLSSERFHSALEKLQQLYHPRTWIDHGSYLKYCYSQGAKFNKDYLLVETLQKYNYNNLWSYHDVNVEALNTLNIFTTNKYSSSKIVGVIFKYFFTGKWLIAAHHFRSLFHRSYKKNIAIDFLMYAMGCTKGFFIQAKAGKRNFGKMFKDYINDVKRFKKIKNNDIVPYSNNDLLKYAPALYCEDRRPFTEYKKNDLLMFSTFETTHLLDIYNEKVLNKLVGEYGTHIGHTYILNNLPYLNHIFATKNGKLKLADKWIKFTETLSSFVKEGKIWNPNMSEYVEYITSLQNIKQVYIKNNHLQITNNNNYAVEGYTLIMPAKHKPIIHVNDAPVNAIDSTNEYHFFVINIQPRKSIEVKYL